MINKIKQSSLFNSQFNPYSWFAAVPKRVVLVATGALLLLVAVMMARRMCSLNGRFQQKGFRQPQSGGLDNPSKEVKPEDPQKRKRIAREPWSSGSDSDTSSGTSGSDCCGSSTDDGSSEVSEFSSDDELDISDDEQLDIRRYDNQTIDRIISFSVRPDGYYGAFIDYIQRIGVDNIVCFQELPNQDILIKVSRGCMDSIFVIPSDLGELKKLAPQDEPGSYLVQNYNGKFPNAEGRELFWVLIPDA